MPSGIKFWEYYIRVPQDIVDDPEIDLSLNEMRLLLYLCRHQIRLGKAQLRLTQDEVLNGRKGSNGQRVDRGSRITCSRDLIQARERLIKLGWLKYYSLEGAWVYELVIQEQPLQVQNAPDEQAGQVQNAPNAPGAKRTRIQVQNAPDSGAKCTLHIRKTQGSTRTQENIGGSVSPKNSGRCYASTLETLKLARATQPDLKNLEDLRQIPLVQIETAPDDFNFVEVAHAICSELALYGEDFLRLLESCVASYRGSHPDFTNMRCGEDLLELWKKYKTDTTIKMPVGIKKFFESGLYLRTDEWRNQPAKAAAAGAGAGPRDAGPMIEERRKRIEQRRNAPQ